MLQSAFFHRHYYYHRRPRAHSGRHSFSAKQSPPTTSITRRATSRIPLSQLIYCTLLLQRLAPPSIFLSRYRSSASGASPVNLIPTAQNMSMDQPPTSPNRARSRGLSFHSDRSGGSKPKVDTHESPAEKARRDRIWQNQSNPNSALSEETPGGTSLHPSLPFDRLFIVCRGCYQPPLQRYTVPWTPPQPLGTRKPRNLKHQLTKVVIKYVT